MEIVPLEVNMLDGLTIRAGNNVVSDTSGHSKKVWLLLAYLICSRERSISREELAQLLWEGERRSSNPPNAIKTTFFRARACLDALWQGAGHQLVLHQGNGYAWNNEIPLTLDLDRFSDLCTGNGGLACWLEAASMFGQGFIPKITSHIWAADTAKKYLKLYLSAVKRALPLLEQQERWLEAADLCQAAAHHRPLDEEFYRRRMMAFIQLGENRKAAHVFEDMSQLFLSRHRAMPSEEIQAVYRRALSNENSPTLAPANIMEQLEEEPERGAFFCDYDIFRALYKLQVRDAERTKKTGCIAVLTATGRQGGELSKHSLDLVMANLRQLVPPLLRQGDAMARCSVAQYVLLLPRASFENGQMVCQRAVKAFGRQYPHSPAAIRVTVCPWKTNMK